MKYLIQFFVIMIFVFLGELCAHFIPFPIAGSVYGLVLLFLALCLHIVKLEWVADVADWMHGIMALFFIVPAVAIIDIWGDIADIWWILLLLLVVAYGVTMITTGITADALINKRERSHMAKPHTKQGRKK